MSIFPLQITPELIRALKAFTARSAERDAINDRARISTIERAIDTVLDGLDSEKRGLIRRVKRTVLGQSHASPDSIAASAARASPFEEVEARMRALDEQTLKFQRVKALLAEGPATVVPPSSTRASRSATAPAPESIGVS